MRRPTIDEVARRAGVSRSTVSRVMLGGAGVRPAVADVVRGVVEELGYVPNTAARNLVRRRSDSVALVVSEDQSPLFGDPFLAGAVHGVSRGLQGTPYRFMIMMASSASDRGWLTDYARSGHVDAVMLAGLRADDPLPHVLHRAGVPMALLGRPEDEQGLPLLVDADNEGGARAAVQHLLAGGRRTVASVSGRTSMRAGRDRRAGYERALTEAGLPVREELVVPGHFTESGGAAAMAELLDREPALDAVFVASDVMAAAATAVLRRSGRRVPEDVAVVGFGDDPAARSCEPPLTTVAQPVEQMGLELARMVVEVLDDPSAARHVVLPTTLVPRASS